MVIDWLLGAEMIVRSNPGHETSCEPGVEATVAVSVELACRSGVELSKCPNSFHGALCVTQSDAHGLGVGGQAQAREAAKIVGHERAQQANAMVDQAHVALTILRFESFQGNRLLEIPAHEHVGSCEFPSREPRR